MELLIPLEPATNVCPQCRGENEEGEDFCRHCGAPLDTSPASRPLAQRYPALDATTPLVLSALLFVLLSLCGTVGYIGYRAFQSPTGDLFPVASTRNPTELAGILAPATPSASVAPPPSASAIAIAGASPEASASPTPSAATIDYEAVNIRYGYHSQPTPPFSRIVIDLRPIPGRSGEPPLYSLRSTEVEFVAEVYVAPLAKVLTPNDDRVGRIDLVPTARGTTELRVKLNAPLARSLVLALRPSPPAEDLYFDRLVFDLYPR